MKKILSLMLSLVLIASLVACGTTPATETSATETTPSAVMDQEISATDATGAFSITSDDHEVNSEGAVFTITAAGTYTLTGYLEGQILIEAGESDEVILELSGTTITYDKDAPIKVLCADKVEISAKKGTENVIRDTRATKTTENSDAGEGAVYAKCDLKMKGSGTLVVEAGYNNGIHTTKDLTIQKLSLKCTAPNNALKGNDSITINSGNVVAVSTAGDGIKTQNTDVNKNGVTRGDVVIAGGVVSVYAAGDGIQAAHNAVLLTGDDGVEPTLAIFTGSYSAYTEASASTSSYKGVKAQNEINISSGVVSIQSYDDGLHADFGTAFDDGTRGQGTIQISGGTITMNVYAPENKTAGGKKGPGGWGNQMAVTGADGIHADSTLNVSGGTITIDSAYEGLEANIIQISGGNTTVFANDDGLNACKGSATPQVKITGGFLDVAVSPSGDTDGIDSNGIYTQSGGVVITRGPRSEMAAAIDADGAITVSGGTLIVLGYGRVQTAGSVKSHSLSLHSAGTHTVTVGNATYTFTNQSAYASTACYSDVSVTA